LCCANDCRLSRAAAARSIRHNSSILEMVGTLTAVHQIPYRQTADIMTTVVTGLAVQIEGKIPSKASITIRIHIAVVAANCLCSCNYLMYFS